MNKKLTILFLLISFISYADAGNGYRFYVKAKLNNSEVHEGYIYVYSWNQYKGFGTLYEFLKNNVPNREIFIYKNINTVHIPGLNLDFAIKDSSNKVKLDNIIDIREVDILNFGGGVYRLHLLSKKEFNKIKIEKPRIESINGYEIAEYCSFIFLTWTKEIDKKLTKSIFKRLENKKKELGNSLLGKNGEIFFSFLNALKIELLDKDILLIQYCESC